MVLVILILDWVLFFAILGIGVVQGYRRGGVTRLAVYLTWFLLPLHAAAFCAFANSLPSPVRQQWRNQFPEGTHVLAFIVSGWFAGILMCGLGAAACRMAHGERLFQDGSEKQNEKHENT
jgi:hypothetical protein